MMFAWWVVSSWPTTDCAVDVAVAEIEYPGDQESVAVVSVHAICPALGTEASALTTISIEPPPLALLVPPFPEPVLLPLLLPLLAVPPPVELPLVGVPLPPPALLSPLPVVFVLVPPPALDDEPL
jgi:hypothetical protein